MTMRFRLRLLFTALLCALLSLALVAPAEARPRHDYPDRIELPDGFLPEGITIGRAPVAYLGSRADGDIYAADLRTGKGRVISQGPGTPSVGLKIDDRGLLYVAGGPSGTARVVNTRTGSYRSYTLTTTLPSFINDVVLTRQAAWFTNSQQPELYRLPRDGRGRQATTLPLSGDWVQAPGFNANGITQTPDGRALLVVNSTTGNLYRVNTRTGAATQVDLGGASLTNGDGMLLLGRTLYVVRNQLNEVAVVKLNRRGTEGRLVDTLTSPDFDVPTTVAAYKGSLYLPNARFGIESPETQEYWITRIDK
jgi:sugar lactone lactonase YvrE